MQIGIDARFWGPVGKGLGRYTQKLIENLESLDNSNQYFVFLGKENFDAYQPKNKKFQKVLADFRWYSFAEQWGMPRLLNKHKLDLVHFPHFNVPLLYFRPFVITIHDLILLHFPTVRSTTRSHIWYWIKFLVYKLVILSAIHRAKRIITVSEFTKKDILTNYGVSESKIEVTYEAVDNFFSQPSNDAENKEKILEKYGIIRPYILYVGNAYPHKNLDRLASAFKMVLSRNSNLHLVLVGKEDYFYHRLKKDVAKKQIKNIIFAGFVPDEDLKTVYFDALAFIFPSLYEGFGLPPLEAMANGTAVASSDQKCMKEILGESALYFNAKNEGLIAEGIEKVINDSELRNSLIQKGKEQVKKYSWERMAKKTLEIYSEK
jgi:glycosyltransferase involved in cell wall biosynthesis